MKLIYVSCKFCGDKKRVEYCENVIKELIKRDRESDIFVKNVLWFGFFCVILQLNGALFNVQCIILTPSPCGDSP